MQLLKPKTYESSLILPFPTHFIYERVVSSTTSTWSISQINPHNLYISISFHMYFATAYYLSLHLTSIISSVVLVLPNVPLCKPLHSCFKKPVALTFSLNKFQASSQSQKSWPFTIYAAASQNHTLCPLTSSHIGLFVSLSCQTRSCIWVTCLYCYLNAEGNFSSCFNRYKCLACNWIPCMDLVYSSICRTSVIK